MEDERGKPRRPIFEWQFDAAKNPAWDRGRGFSIAARRCIRRGRAPKALGHPPLAWLRLPARLSSAAQQQRPRLWSEGSDRRHGVCSKILVWRWAVLFRPSWIFRWTLQRRQLRSMLDPYTYRTDLELRMSA